MTLMSKAQTRRMAHGLTDSQRHALFVADMSGRVGLENAHHKAIEALVKRGLLKPSPVLVRTWELTDAGREVAR